MSTELMIASLESGGGMAMLGIVLLIGAAVGLLYLLASRRRRGASLGTDQGPNESLGTDQGPNEGDRSDAA
jgi:hypothetical protein